MVEHRKETETQNELHFAVIDGGIGIADEQQAAIFEPFTQADGSSERQHGGTGLGLTIATRLVKMMGGEIWVRSRPNVGSAFHFTAFFDKDIDEAVAKSEISNEMPAAVNAAYAKPKTLEILVAEDNLVNQKMISRLIEKHGHRVTIANNGEDVLTLLRNLSFDLYFYGLSDAGP